MRPGLRPPPRLPLPPFPPIPLWYREPGLWLPLSCAIAYDSDAAGAATNGTTSQSVSLTIPSGSTALFASVVGDVTDVITTVTWNAVAMTKISSDASSAGRFVYLYYLASPGSGAHSLVANASSSIYIGVCGASYTGTSVTSQPEAFGSAGSNSSPQSASASVVTASSWLVGAGRSQGGSIGAGTGTTKRADDGFGGGLSGIFDSNAGVSTGSQSLAITGSSNLGLVVAAIAPAAVGGGGGQPTSYYARQRQQ